MRRQRVIPTEKMRARDWLMLIAVCGGFPLAALGGLGVLPWWAAVAGGVAAAIGLAFAAAP